MMNKNDLGERLGFGRTPRPKQNDYYVYVVRRHNGEPLYVQGDRISKQGQEPSEVGVLPTGSFELAPE